MSLPRDRRWNIEHQRWEYPVVDHLDGDPSNNDVANLSLVWPSDSARAGKTDAKPETTVEAVAGAIGYALAMAGHDLEDGPLEAAARAALTILREPTEAQYDALSATGKMWRELDSKTVWQTYIDAALSGTKP